MQSRYLDVGRYEDCYLTYVIEIIKAKNDSRAVNVTLTIESIHCDGIPIIDRLTDLELQSALSQILI